MFITTAPRWIGVEPVYREAKPGRVTDRGTADDDADKGDSVTVEDKVAGTPNAVYDAVSVLYHALQAGAQYNEYIRDAEVEGDRELADFFRRTQQEDAQRADELKRLINTRLVTSGTSS